MGRGDLVVAIPSNQYFDLEVEGLCEDEGR